MKDEPLDFLSNLFEEARWKHNKKLVQISNDLLDECVIIIIIIIIIITKDLKCAGLNGLNFF